VPPPGRQSLDYKYITILCVVALGVFVSCVQFLSVSLSHSDAGVTTFYQDLNSVEIKIGSAPLDPRIIEAIHHFQKYPFGKNPDSLEQGAAATALVPRVPGSSRSVFHGVKDNCPCDSFYLLLFACFSLLLIRRCV